jgi:hypothetical protein
MDGIFVEVWMARSVPVDIFPCGSAIKVQLVGGYTHNGAIFVVQKFVVEGETAFEKGADAGYRRDGIYLWARKFGERVNCYSVDCLRLLRGVYFGMRELLQD